jgi:hypothetical protein
MTAIENKMLSEALTASEMDYNQTIQMDTFVDLKDVRSKLSIEERWRLVENEVDKIQLSVFDNRSG